MATLKRRIINDYDLIPKNVEELAITFIEDEVIYTTHYVKQKGYYVYNGYEVLSNPLVKEVYDREHFVESIVLNNIKACNMKPTHLIPVRAKIIQVLAMESDLSLDEYYNLLNECKEAFSEDDEREKRNLISGIYYLIEDCGRDELEFIKIIAMIETLVLHCPSFDGLGILEEDYQITLKHGLETWKSIEG